MELVELVQLRIVLNRMLEVCRCPYNMIIGRKSKPSCETCPILENGICRFKLLKTKLGQYHRQVEIRISQEQKRRMAK